MQQATQTKQTEPGAKRYRTVAAHYTVRPVVVTNAVDTRGTIRSYSPTFWYFAVRVFLRINNMNAYVAMFRAYCGLYAQTKE